MRRYTLSVLERQILQANQTRRFGAITPLNFDSESNNFVKRELSRLQPSNQVLLTSKAFYSQEPGKRPSFFGNILSNLKQNVETSKEMQDSLKKFREEAQKLEESDALKEARRKFESIESETSKNTGAVKDQLADKLKAQFDEISKTDAAKKAGEFTQNLGKQAESIGKVAGETAENISKSNVFKSATEVASTLKEEIEGQGGKVYRRRLELRKRKEVQEVSADEKPIEINEEATGVELHKDSKFYATWESFKNSNPVYNRIIDYRMKYEESDNPMVRGARLVTDKVQDIFGGMFSRTELSEVLTEIVKMDPNFCKEQFLKDCERDIIPNILEAFCRGNLEILEDWCFEGLYNILATPIKQAQGLGYMFDSQLLDIDDVDLVMGKMTEAGPVLAITFSVQSIDCLRDMKGAVVQGDPDKVMRNHYIWVLCRDQAELDPKAAWRLMEMQIQSSAEQFL